ncbi:hypothetical protein BKA61DRAFT_572708 [Leptodontidium sp. MPI-SDFR-AT-0119]|nr:hypothetical protein BKA61DRAFT_572708 [Leptodontidium sp. MPI-SDFR-AT-0119]
MSEINNSGLSVGLNSSGESTQTEGTTIDIHPADRQLNCFIASDPNYAQKKDGSARRDQTTGQSEMKETAVQDNQESQHTQNIRRSEENMGSQHTQPTEPTQARKVTEMAGVMDGTRATQNKPKKIKVHPLVAALYPWTPEMLARLEILNMRSITIQTEQDKEEIPGLLLRCFKEMKSLKVLKFNLSNFRDVIPIATICRTGETLRELVATDFSRIGTDLVSLNDLRELLENCPLLETLEVDLPIFPYRDIAGLPDRLTFEASDFLDLLLEFRSLTDLRLHADYSLGAKEYVDYESTDPDCDEAEWIMKDLLRHKKGFPLEKLVLELHGAYRPKNWRKPAGEKFEDELDAQGNLKMWVTSGSERVGDPPNETEDERAEAEREWRIHQELYGDGIRKHRRSKFSPGMAVTLNVADEGDEKDEAAVDNTVPGKSENDSEAAIEDSNEVAGGEGMADDSVKKDESTGEGVLINLSGAHVVGEE